jgi:hypothetical protein
MSKQANKRTSERAQTSVKAEEEEEAESEVKVMKMKEAEDYWLQTTGRATPP